MSRSGLRVLRFVVVATLLIVVIYKLSTERLDLSDYVSVHTPDGLKAPAAGDAGVPAAVATTGATVTSGGLLVDTSAPLAPGIADAALGNPLVVPGAPQSALPYQRANAVFVTLARNSDLKGLMGSIRQVEDRFNDKYHYDWVFFNDEEFSEEFKKLTSAIVSGTTKYGLIPKEHWSIPDFIDRDKAALAREKMESDGIIYGGSLPYRHMCRFESGFFWRHPLLDEYKYYWRVEPDIRLHCDIDYDLFKYMEENKKRYGFAVSLYEYVSTIETLWDTTKAFLGENPQYVSADPMMDFISDDGGESYNLCHFWSNFEIADLDLWRGEAYTKYFEYLDQTGGFFYERWGDAPVHSIAAALFLNRTEIHFFDDVGYFHNPFNNCPTREEDRLRLKCLCYPEENFTWNGYSCMPRYYDIMKMDRPKGWSDQA